MRFIVLCFIALLLLLPTMAQEDAPAPSGEIAFVSNRDEGVWQIYVMNADGANVRQLTDASTNSLFPGWSPDGQKIAFMREIDPSTVYPQRLELWVMEADGTDAVMLARDDGEEGFISIPSLPVIWSPDSEQVLYGRYLPDEQRIEYHLVRADGSETRSLSYVEDVYQAHFLADDVLLFTLTPGDVYQGLLYDLSDNSTTTLIENGFALQPSPDGTLIPVMVGEQLTLFDVSTETSQIVRETLPGLLPDEVGQAISQLVWSDDGSRLAGVLRVAVPDDPNSEMKPWRDLIFAVNVDGTEYVALEIDGHEFHVTLSPDGEYMAFPTWDEGGALQIALARADGTEPPILITSEGENLTPTWRPVP